nr:MAG TPA: hypothetical protein [Caudoviricetes sp.]
MNTIITSMTQCIKTSPARSAWKKGVKTYALEMLENNIKTEITAGLSEKELERRLLAGASTWYEYSWDGRSLIYNEDIAARLCAPWELRKTDNGSRRPNAHERWLDVQARALWQAEWLICKAYRAACEQVAD